jgi:hypothetical protein
MNIAVAKNFGRNCIQPQAVCNKNEVIVIQNVSPFSLLNFSSTWCLKPKKHDNKIGTGFLSVFYRQCEDCLSCLSHNNCDSGLICGQVFLVVVCLDNAGIKRMTCAWISSIVSILPAVTWTPTHVPICQSACMVIVCLAATFTPAKSECVYLTQFDAISRPLIGEQQGVNIARSQCDYIDWECPQNCCNQLTGV